MALIRKDDLRLLAKREPELNANLQKSLSLSILGTVSLQFTNLPYASELRHQVVPTTTKKVSLYLEQLALTKDEITFMNDPRNRNK
jgi:hypothetical protein